MSVKFLSDTKNPKQTNLNTFQLNFFSKERSNGENGQGKFKLRYKHFYNLKYFFIDRSIHPSIRLFIYLSPFTCYHIHILVSFSDLKAKRKIDKAFDIVCNNHGRSILFISWSSIRTKIVSHTHLPKLTKE